MYWEYSTGKKSMSEFGKHRTTVFRHIKDDRERSINLPVDNDYHRFIFLDGKWTDNICTLIGRDKFFVFKFQHVEHENSETWFNFIKDVQEPEVVVCDCQKGLLKAIRAVWPRAKIQLCIFHRLQSIDAKLTKNPILHEAIELRKIRLLLAKVDSFKLKYQFINAIEEWTKKNQAFINEKTYCLNGKRKWFYSHKNIRAAWKILLNCARSENTFVYLDTPGCPRTNNYSEAGLNSQVEKIRNAHQGQTLKHRINMLEAYLFKRSKFWTGLWSLINKKKH